MTQYHHSPFKFHLLQMMSRGWGWGGLRGVISASEPRPYRSALHDVPPDGLVPAALAEVQQVVHHDLADQVVSGETVEVVHGEVQLPGM